MKKEVDTILCKDKKDAHRVIDDIGHTHIADWEFLEAGKIRLILDCRIGDM